MGITGFIAGAGFSLFLGTTYRHHGLEDLRASRIALWGAIVSGMVAPALSIAAIGFGASGIGLGFLSANAIGAAVFGALAAGGTVALAQRSSRQPGKGELGDKALPQER